MDDDERDRQFSCGYNAAMRTILAECIRAIGQEGDAERWRLERMATVAALRSICGDFGDNDWPDDLHLADVVEKHLARPLHDRLEDEALDAKANAERD